MCLPVRHKSILNIVDMTVCIQTQEKVDFRIDIFTCEVTATREPILLVKRYCPILLVHGIQEASGLIVAEIYKGLNVESSHHLMVLMDQIVTMEHVKTIPWSINIDSVSDIVE